MLQPQSMGSGERLRRGDRMLTVGVLEENSGQQTRLRVVEGVERAGNELKSVEGPASVVEDGGGEPGDALVDRHLGELLGHELEQLRQPSGKAREPFDQVLRCSDLESQ